MKVEIKISPDIEEPYAMIAAKQLTREIQRAAAILEEGSRVVAGIDNERICLMQPEEIYLVRVELECTLLYGKEKRFESSKRLYQLEELLGADFMRISKSAIINLRKIDSVELSFHGMMCLQMKNGMKECISRKYLPDFKTYLGM